MKKNWIWHTEPFPCFTKTWRIMRLSVFFLCVMAAQTWALDSYSQGTRLSLNLKDTRVIDILGEIEEKTEFYFLFNQKLLDVERKVDIEVRQRKIDDILNELFAGTNVNYLVMNRQIVLTTAQPGSEEYQQQTSEQQQGQVSGKVTDRTGAPLPGVTVVIKGTTTGTITNADGLYTISNIPANATLVFSFVGMRTQEMIVGNQTVINVSLQDETFGIEEVVAIGYGVQKKKLSTGATLQVDGANISKMNTINPLGAVQSQMPGVNIMQNSGQPGSDFKVKIRGAGTIGNTSPLFVVDGIIVNSINDLNPSDIESMDVLKDAASAAIYGSRAANGVILITTKKGKTGKLAVTLDGYYGVQNIAKHVDLLNAQQYAMIMDEAAKNSGLAPFNFANLVPDWDKIKNNQWSGTNWIKEASNENAPVQNYSLNVAGGGEAVVYSFGLSYANQDGIIGKPSAPNYTRYTARINSEGTILKSTEFDILKIGENFTFSNLENSRINDTNWNNSGIFQLLRTSPFLPAYNPDGTYHSAIPWAGGMEANPIANMDYNQGHNFNRRLQFRGNTYLIFQPIKNLIFRSSYGINSESYSYRSYVPKYKLTNDNQNANARVNQSMGLGLGWMFENTLTYTLNLKEVHQFDALMGFSAEKRGIGENINGTNTNPIFDDFDHAYLSNSKSIISGQTSLFGSPYIDSRLMSMFGRINYNYKEKYLATFVMRADGSSNFAKGNQWGYFPSVSGGWVISNENFLRETQAWMDFLKLRASWGQNGNQAIPPFQYLSTISFNSVYVFGEDKSTRTTGAFPNIMSNPDITWETSEQTNIGFDARFLKSRLSLTLDYYVKNTEDWLVQAPVLASYGTGAPYINGGNIRNSGLEFATGWNDRAGELKYGINVNFTHNQNEVTAIANTEGIIHGPANALLNQTTEMYRAQVGYPIGYFWGFKTNGIFQTIEEVNNYTNSGGIKIQPNALPGDIKFKDLNDDGKIDANDKTMIGDPNPDFTFGLSFNMAYKGFDLNFASYGSIGNQIAQSYRMAVDKVYDNYTTEVLNRWTGPGSTNKYPRVTYSSSANDINISDRYIKSGDFWRINNLTLGYDFKVGFKELPLQQLRAYVAVNNLATITSYNGMDPEVGFANNSWASGLDIGFYPSPRTVMFGVTIKY
jgi:TonB-dependent starch-binding outer membrane protein SusC